MEPLFFIAHGRSLEVVSALLEDRRKSTEDRIQWAKAHGAIGYFGDDRSWMGIICKLTLDDPGWKLHGVDEDTKENVYVPDVTNVKGKGYRTAMHKMGAIPGPIELTTKLGLWGGTHPVTGKPLFCSCAKIGDLSIISVPFNCPKTPLDAVPLKRSEYWKLVEDEDDRIAAGVNSEYSSAPTAYSLLVDVAKAAGEVILSYTNETVIEMDGLVAAHRAYSDYIEEQGRIGDKLMQANTISTEDGTPLKTIQL